MSNHIFIESEPISSKIAPIIQDEIIDKIHKRFPELGCLKIGSVGKKKDERALVRGVPRRKLTLVVVGFFGFV